MYEQKEFAENAPFIWTEKGERVRSKSEKILADYFYHKKILYQYERPLYLKGFGTVHPILRSCRERQEKKFIGNMMAEWMIRYMHRMLSKRYRHMKKMGFIQENV